MKKILLIEDEEVLGKLYKKYLERGAKKVIWTETANKAKKVVKELAPDLIIVDHGLTDNETSGLDLIRRFRKECPSSKIIMLSNYNHDRLRKDALKAGALEFLVKLYTSPIELSKHVEKLLT